MTHVRHLVFLMIAPIVVALVCWAVIVSVYSWRDNPSERLSSEFYSVAPGVKSPFSNSNSLRNMPRHSRYCCSIVPVSP